MKKRCWLPENDNWGMVHCRWYRVVVRLCTLSCRCQYVGAMQEPINGRWYMVVFRWQIVVCFRQRFDSRWWPLYGKQCHVNSSYLFQDGGQQMALFDAIWSLVYGGLQMVMLRWGLVGSRQCPTEGRWMPVDGSVQALCDD